MRRQQLRDPLEEGLAPEAELESQVFGETFPIRFDGVDERQQCFDLLGKIQRAANDGVI